MNGKRVLTLLLALAFCLCVAGCGSAGFQSKDAVPVQSVSMLMGLDLSGTNRYCGVAEAKSTEKVKKDANKDIDQVKVAVGDDVHKGDVLFTYDLESVRLGVEAAQLEVEQLANSITSYDKQIAELEKDKRRASSSEKLSYSLEIQEAMLDKAEAEYNLKKKEKELAKLEKSAQNTEVKAGVDGVVQSISQEGLSGGEMEEGSGGDTFLTIVETGTYRIKGTANETSIGALYEGLRVVVYSRTDYTQQWLGAVSELDTGSVDSGNDQEDSFGGEEEGNESSSRYSFYVTLDNSDGMMMGQHVYILPGDLTEPQGIRLNAAFVEQDGEGAYVWAVGSKDTLERRAVTLGTYDELSDSYEITEGLELTDYVAQVAPALAEGESVVKYDSESLEDEGDSSAEGDLYAEDGSFPEGDFYDSSAFGEESYGEEYLEDGSAPVALESSAEDAAE